MRPGRLSSAHITSPHLTGFHPMHCGTWPSRDRFGASRGCPPKADLMHCGIVPQCMGHVVLAANPALCAAISRMEEEIIPNRRFIHFHWRAAPGVMAIELSDHGHDRIGTDHRSRNGRISESEVGDKRKSLTSWKCAPSAGCLSLCNLDNYWAAPLALFLLITSERRCNAFCSPDTALSQPCTACSPVSGETTRPPRGVSLSVPHFPDPFVRGYTVVIPHLACVRAHSGIP